VPIRASPRRGFVHVRDTRHGVAITDRLAITDARGRAIVVEVAPERRARAGSG